MTLVMHGGVSSRSVVAAGDAQRQGCCLAVIDPCSQQLLKLEHGGRVGAHGVSLGTHLFSERNSIAVRSFVDEGPGDLLYKCMRQQHEVFCCLESCGCVHDFHRGPQGILSTSSFFRCELACVSPTCTSARRMC